MSPDLDEAVLHYTSEGDPEFEQELIAIFMASLEVSMREFEAVILSHDMNRIARAAHYTRGGAGSIGAQRLAEANTALEQAANSGDFGAIENAIPEIREAYRRLKVAVAKRAAV
jgi:HPt (histidine-containing phosphotransfer) domain-containing protein